MRLPILLCFGAIAAPLDPVAAQFAPHSWAMPSAGPAAVVPGWGNGLGDVRHWIDQGQRSGQLTRHEAHQLRREAGAIGVLQDRFGRDGLSAAEAQELAVRTTVLRDQVDARRAGAPTQAR